MALERIDVRDLLRRTLQFYEGGNGTSNRMYENPTTEAQVDRNNKAELAQEAMAIAFDRAFDTMPVVAKGDYLRNRNLKFGNCAEMAAVAASFLNSNLALASQVKHAAVALAEDHEFLFISDGSNPFAAGKPTIEDDFGKPEHQGAWVVDPWMGIACRLHEYGPLMQAKWQRDGLVVAGSSDMNSNDVPIPTDIQRDFVQKTLGSELETKPVRLSQQYQSQSVASTSASTSQLPQQRPDHTPEFRFKTPETPESWRLRHRSGSQSDDDDAHRVKIPKSGDDRGRRLHRGGR
jgi:hypothetical protein